MEPRTEQPRVSSFIRVLAWVFLICAVVATALMLIAMAKGYREWPMSSVETALFILGAVLFLPVFVIVAFKGRPPRWWGYFDEALNIDKALDRYAEKRGFKK